MNRLGVATLAFAAGMLFGYFADDLMGSQQTPLDKCLSDASQRPTERGVTLAARVCHQTFPQPTKGQ